MIENFNRHKNTFYNKKNECEKEKKISITLDQLDNFFKNIIRLAQIFGGPSPIFVG